MQTRPSIKLSKICNELSNYIKKSKEKDRNSWLIFRNHALSREQIKICETLLDQINFILISYNRNIIANGQTTIFKTVSSHRKEFIQEYIQTALEKISKLLTPASVYRLTARQQLVVSSTTKCSTQCYEMLKTYAHSTIEIDSEAIHFHAVNDNEEGNKSITNDLL